MLRWPTRDVRSEPTEHRSSTHPSKSPGEPASRIPERLHTHTMQGGTDDRAQALRAWRASHRDFSMWCPNAAPLWSGVVASPHGECNAKSIAPPPVLPCGSTACFESRSTERSPKSGPSEVLGILCNCAVPTLGTIRRGGAKTMSGPNSEALGGARYLATRPQLWYPGVAHLRPRGVAWTPDSSPSCSFYWLPLVLEPTSLICARAVLRFPHLATLS